MEIHIDSGAAGAARAQVEADVGQPGVQRAVAGRVASASPAPGATRALEATLHPLSAVVPLMPQRPSFSFAVDAFPPAAGYALSAGSGGASKASSSTSASAKTAAAKAASSKSSSARSSTSKTTSTSKSTSSSKTSTSRELAFLDSKTMSIEDKLFQFMVLMQQKSDKELEQAMKDYDAKKTASSKSSSSSDPAEKPDKPEKPEKHDSGDGGGLFGFVGDVLGGVAKGVGGVVESAAKELGGPLLAAGVTALGAPWLVPAALSVGGGLASGVVHAATTALDGGSSSSSSHASTSSGGSSSSSATKSSSSTGSTSTGSSSGTAGSDAAFDERIESMKLQRLVDKQQEMFSTISNMLKTMHDMQMTAIGNIR